MKFIQIRMTENNNYNLIVNQENALGEYKDFVKKLMKAQQHVKLFEYESSQGNFVCNPDHLISVLLMEMTDKKDEPILEEIKA